MLEHKQPTIYGDGKQSRDFTFVQNVVKANCLAADASLENKHEHINIACNESIDLTTLTKYIIEDMSKFDAEIEKILPIYAEARLGDIKDSLASIEKAKAILGYEPDILVRKGIEITTRWFYENR